MDQLGIEMWLSQVVIDTEYLWWDMVEIIYDGEGDESLYYTDESSDNTDDGVDWQSLDWTIVIR